MRHPAGAKSIPSAAPVGERLGRMAEFMMHLTGPGGRIVQIGDHDSGRLFKLQPGPRPDRVFGNGSPPKAPIPDPLPVPDEEYLSVGNAVAGINGLLRRTDLTAWCAGRWLDEQLVAGLAGETSWRSMNEMNGPTQAERRVDELRGGFDELCRRLRTEPAVESSRAVLAVAGGASLQTDICGFAYSDFGAYVFRSNRLFLCLRAGFGRRDGAGGHAHVDQLGLDVSIDGVGWIRDPGSYVYTADPDWRNAYRSGAAHFVPYILEGEAGLWRNGLFDLALDVRVLAVAVEDAAVAVELAVAGNRIGQIVTVEPQEIVVEARLLQVSPTSRLRARLRRVHDGRYVFGRDNVTSRRAILSGVRIAGSRLGRGRPVSSFAPIFVVGVGRSGTSLVQSMLAAHSQVAFPPEMQFVRRYLGRGRLARAHARGGVAAVRNVLEADDRVGRLGLDLGRVLSRYAGATCLSPRPTCTRSC